MSDAQTSAFGRFVPGFDFLQNLAKGASDAMPQVPGLSNWIAPTLSIEEVDKRISELRAVQFWLEQNGRALAATVQALEVQKMTLATLQGMDVSLSELADSMRVRPAPASAAAPQEPAAAPAEPSGEPPAAGKSAGQEGSQATAGVIDPVQWWTALTQQFQQIAANALQETAARGGPFEAGRQVAESMMAKASQAGDGSAAAKPSKTAAPQRAARKRAPAKSAARKASTPRKAPGAR